MTLKAHPTFVWQVWTGFCQEQNENFKEKGEFIEFGSEYEIMINNIVYGLLNGNVPEGFYEVIIEKIRRIEAGVDQI